MTHHLYTSIYIILSYLSGCHCFWFLGALELVKVQGFRLGALSMGPPRVPKRRSVIAAFFVLTLAYILFLSSYSRILNPTTPPSTAASTLPTSSPSHEHEHDSVSVTNSLFTSPLPPPPTKSLPLPSSSHTNMPTASPPLPPPSSQPPPAASPTSSSLTHIQNPIARTLYYPLKYVTLDVASDTVHMHNLSPGDLDLMRNSKPTITNRPGSIPWSWTPQQRHHYPFTQLLPTESPYDESQCSHVEKRSVILSRVKTGTNCFACNQGHLVINVINPLFTWIWYGAMGYERMPDGGITEKVRYSLSHHLKCS